MSLNKIEVRNKKAGEKPAFLLFPYDFKHLLDDLISPESC